MKKIRKLLPVLLITLMAVIAMTFSGCVEADFIEFELKMTDKGYIVASKSIDNDEAIGQDAPGCIAFVEARKGDFAVEEYVKAFFFSTEDQAIDYFVNEFNEDDKSSALNQLKKNPTLYEKTVYGRVGKIVIYGTQEAYNDALA